MCHLPSWIECEDGSILFLEDKDIDLLPNEMQSDAHGHAAIRSIYPKAGGNEKEGWRGCPKVILDSMQAGRMDRIIKASGVRVFFPRDGQTITPASNEDVYIVRKGAVASTNQSGGYCRATDNAKLTSTNQSGGYCRAYGNAKLTSTNQSGGDCRAYGNAKLTSTNQSGGDCRAEGNAKLTTKSTKK